MAKKHTTVTSSSNKAQTKTLKSTSKFNIGQSTAIGVCLLYFAVHFIPDFDAYDNFGPQWLYIVILDIVVTLGILAKKDSFIRSTSSVFGNLFSKLYLAFFILAGLSIFTAINPTEGWVCYVRLIATVVAYFNLSILLYDKTEVFEIIAQLLAIILFVESFQTIYQYLHNSDNLSYGNLILSLKGTTGNKNIFAASTVIKIPFVLFCIYKSRLLGIILNSLILFAASLTIFLVSARASYLSLILIILLYLAFLITAYLKEKKIDKLLYSISTALIPIIFSLFISQILITNTKNILQEKGGYGTVTDRLGSVTKFNADDNQVRIQLWEHAIDYTKHHPIIGCGFGNWKISSIPYQRGITNELIVPVHSHNDYFEMFAELGIIGGLLYLSLFFCIAFFTLKTFLSKKTDSEIKLISVFTFLAFIGYSIDAFFNFPMERPITQVFFAFITTFNVIAFIKSKNSESSEEVKSKYFLKPLFGLVALLLLIPSFYITYTTYKSLIVQKDVLGDLNNEPLKLDWKEVLTSLPSIPNLSATGQPIDAIKGRYVYEAGKYKSIPGKLEEALILLDKGRPANPVIAYSEFLKAGVYFSLGKYDSAKRNALEAFYTRPRAKTYYQTLVAVLAHEKDTSNIKQAYLEAKKYRNEEYVWNLYLQGMINSYGKGNPKLLSVVDSSLKLFPNDSTLLVRKNEILRTMDINPGTPGSANPINLALAQKYYADAVVAFGKGVDGKDDLQMAANLFLKSASINPADYSAFENAAICYFNMKNWKKSIEIFDREMAMNASTTGKPEYFKGIAFINIGQKEQGCTLLKVALKKGWQAADAIIKGNCN